MRKLALVILAAAAVGATIPLTATSADAAKVVIKSGDRGHHYGWRNHNRRKVVVIKRGPRHEYRHRHGTRVIVR